MSHVDIISDVLAAAMRAFPDSAFVQGMSHQYLVKGGLSKGQLEGLYKKAESIKGLPPAKLATLEAIILKRHKKYRSAPPVPVPSAPPDDATGRMMEEILQSYPQHKRVLFLQAKYKAAGPLSATEAAELAKFHKLLVR